MHGYNMIEAQIYYPESKSLLYTLGRMQLVLQALIIVQTIIPGISIWYKVASIAIASVTGANYCPNTYLIMHVVSCLLTIMLHKEATVLVNYRQKTCKSICSSIKCSILSSYELDDYSSSCIGKTQPKNMYISLNMKSSWLTSMDT